MTELVLAEGERDELVRLAKRARVNRNLAFRARIVLACTEATNSAVALSLRTTNQTVGKWRKRFVEDRLDGLYDEPRVGAPRSISDDEVERTAAGTLTRTTAAAQRLGYLLEEAGKALPSGLANLRPVRAVRLRPENRSRGPYSTRWRVYA